MNSYFPITNASILDGTISQSKIQNLVCNLTHLQNNLTSIQNNLNSLTTQEQADILLLTNNLTSQINKEASDILNLQNSITSLLTSTVGTTTNPYQPQIDTLNTNLSTNITATNNNSSAITSLQSSNTQN